MKKEENLNIIKEDEQWKLYGDCKKCRKSNYCSKPCTCNIRYNRAEIENTVADIMDKITGGAMKNYHSMYMREL